MSVGNERRGQEAVTGLSRKKAGFAGSWQDLCSGGAQGSDKGKMQVKVIHKNVSLVHSKISIEHVLCSDTGLDRPWDVFVRKTDIAPPPRGQPGWGGSLTDMGERLLCEVREARRGRLSRRMQEKTRGSDRKHVG